MKVKSFILAGDANPRTLSLKQVGGPEVEDLLTKIEEYTGNASMIDMQTLIYIADDT